MAVDLEQPLLLKKKGVYPNCAGCKAAYLRSPDAKIPYKELAIVAAITLINVLPNSSLYPFLYFMVRDFHIAKSEKEIGYFAGFLGSVFMLGRFFTGMQWGMVADKFGRKPVMIIGVSSVIVFHTLFGVSTTFWAAVLSRFLLGCFNGMLGTVKAYASEICSQRHQALSSSIIGTIWSLGLIIGPAMGGYLAQPATKYPNVFPPGSLFDRFPYLLPSVAVTTLAIPVCVASFHLPETLHKHGHGRKAFEGLGSPTPASPVAGSSPHESRPAIGPGIKNVVTAVPQADERKGCQGDQANKSAGSGAEDEEEEKRVATLPPEKGSAVSKPEGEKKSLLTSRPLMASIALYCMTSLNTAAFTEIFSLWCVTPAANGGLSLDTTDVGQILAISGLVMLVFQILAFPPLIKCMGAVLVPRTAALISVPIMALLSLVPLLHGATLWAALCLASVVRSILSAMIFTSCFMLVNNSVTQDQRGAANGVAMCAVSLFKAIGPAGGGSIFAWANSRQDERILPGNELVFFLLGAISLIVALTTFEPLMPRSLESPMAEEDEYLA